MAPRSFRDPAYARLAAQMEAKHGLPKGLLHAVVTKGERSNADQVSEAGAKTVFQIIPATRKAALDKYGIDAYRSAENAAEVAALLLKESLERNDGDVRQAVGEYHGGTDRAQWGPRTKAYISRVTGSTFDRVKAQREKSQAEGPSIAKVYEAYKAGKLSPEEARQFVADVNAGAIMLPRGADLGVKPDAQELPKGVVEAYNSHSEMTDAERDQLDADIAEGLVRAPKGMGLRRPAARTIGDQLGMGTRAVMKGVEDMGNLQDLVLAPLVKPLESVARAMGLDSMPTADEAADAVGFARPGTPGEKLVGEIIRGGTQGAYVAPLSAAAAGPRAAAVVAQEVVGGGAAGGASEQARQAGAPPIIQFGLGLGAGVKAAAGINALEGVAKKFGQSAAKVAAETPRAVVLDEAGKLTEEGQELAVRWGVTEAQVKGAYDELEAANAQAADQSVARAVNDGMPDGVRVEEPPVAAAPEPRPANESAPPPAAAVQRVEEAQSVGVDLTRGQALQDAEIQAAEYDARGVGGPEGRAVQEHFAKQQEQIKAALEKYQAGFGDPSLGPTERGAIVREALGELRDQGKAGVTAMYDQARKLAQEVAGDQGSNLVRLDTEPLLKGIREVLIDEGVDEGVRKALRQQAAQYQMIGGSPRTFEDGSTVVRLRAADGSDGPTITLSRPPEPLTILNAENFRQFLNSQWKNDSTGALAPIKGLIDDAVERAVERAATEGKGGVGEAFKAARAAHREQKQTFASKDIVQKILEVKSGTGTDAMLPEKVIDAIYAGGPDGVTNLKRIRAALLSKPTEKSRAAWRAIQAHGVARIIAKSMNNATGDVSGAALKRAINEMGRQKLKVLLGPADFNALMKLERVVKAATVAPDGAKNTSGTAYAVVRMVNQQLSRLMPAARLTGIGQVIDGVTALVRQGQQLAKSKEAIRGVTQFTSEDAAKAEARAVKPKVGVGGFLREFAELAGSTQILAPLLASTAAVREAAPEG